MFLSVSLKSCARLWLLILMVAFPISARASISFIPPVPTNMDTVEIYLLTRGAGAEVYTKYGHTMIRVVDPSHNLDVAYNWGAFNFGEPGFIGKFLRGFLRYYLDISPAYFEVRISEIEQRWLVQERLNLTRRQKAVLLAELNREAQPDRRHYRYLFFADNCSTRPRDVIDKALDGKIAAGFQGKGESGATFRRKVIDYNASVPILAMGQDVILSSEVDRGISRWEEMFIPLKLREYLLSMPAYNDDGRVRGGKLLSDKTILTAFPDPVNPPYNGYVIFWVLLGTPMLLGMALYLTSFQKAGIRVLSLALLLWGAVSGIFGLYLTLAWAFSEHTVVHHNANLAIFWPFDWYFLFWGGMLLVKGVLPLQGSLLAKLTGWIVRGHLAALGIYGLLAISGFFTQDVTRVLGYFGSQALLFYGLILYLSDLKLRK